MLVSLIKKVFSNLTINKRNKLRSEPIKICLIYFTIGFLWIYFSDRIVNKIITNNTMLLLISTYKGWLYVILTSVIIYSLINNLLKKVELTERKLNESYSELSSVNEELEAYVQQLAASEEELRAQYDQIIENERMLSKSEEKNRAIVQALPDLLFIVNDEGYFIDCMTNDINLLLMPKEFFMGKAMKEILPKEISKIAYEKLQLVLKNGLMECFEYELTLSNTKQYYELRMVKNNDKEVLAISRNITIKKQAEETIKESEYNYRNIFERSSDPILIIENTKVIDCNLAMIELLGYDSKSCLLNKYLHEFSPEKQPDGETSKTKEYNIYNYTSEKGKYKFEWWYKKTDGSLLPVEIMMTTILLNGKKVVHSLSRDISGRKQMEYELEYLSYHDQLTGLYNRRFFEKELQRLDTEPNLPLTIIMADVNGLKLVNDSFGHTFGDELLRKVSEVIKKGCRSFDIIARLGGDEFVILLPKTDSYEAEEIVNKIRAIALKEKVCSVDISISLGYETKNNHDEKIEEILNKAEDYMYKKKLFESPSMRGKTIDTIISTLNEKNKREEEHSHRVSTLSKSMGKALMLCEYQIKELKTVGLLHDIGKIAIDENILNKQGKLTDEEWEEIQKHPEVGYRILSTVPGMLEIAEYVLAHHERWDGTGYPKGLKGEEIPLQSRIISIADSYDAMVSQRSYRNALPEEVVLNELRINAGIQFDPFLVNAFIEKVLNKSFD